jgi:gamma-glutamyl phosphate reductase
MQDRLRLTEERITAMAEGIRQVATLPDPIRITAFPDLKQRLAASVVTFGRDS